VYIAMPGSPNVASNPNWGTAKNVRDLYFKAGFLTYPLFLDNYYIQEAEAANVEAMRRHLRAFGKFGLIQFGVLPDNDVEESRKLLEEYPQINWIWVLHDRVDDLTPYRWIGYPHKKERRNYSATEFLRITRGKKRWYLGLWDSINPHLLTNFDGFDTLIPMRVATFYHSKWTGWKQREKAHSDFGLVELLQYNVTSFKDYILKNVITVANQTKLEGEF
jgi:hypothetical protein